MEKVAFVEFLLVACLGLLLFGSKLTFLEERILRHFRSSKPTSDVDLEDMRTHHR